MERWVRFQHRGEILFGTLADAAITVHRGDLFTDPTPTSTSIAISEVTLLVPTTPRKLIGLWNNFGERAAREGLTRPEHPLYFLKASSSCLPSGQAIRQPTGYAGPVVFEGELGIVIGKRCAGVSPDQAHHFVFGYTCVNDVTARAILKQDPSFPQWSRAKSFDTFGAIGPAIATGIEPDQLCVRTYVNGQLRQDYPVADMFFHPPEIVSRLSHDMTLEPGDIIACGTSIGAAPLDNGDRVEVAIEGIGTLSNVFLR